MSHHPGRPEGHEAYREDLAAYALGALDEREAAELTDAEALRRETTHELRGALSELPAEQSKVIELAYFGGFSHSEIGAMLEVPLGTVKGRMRLGLEKIRGELAEGWV